MDFVAFIKTRTITPDVTLIEGWGWQDMYDEPTSGFLYNGGSLFIEQISPPVFGDPQDGGDYLVELWGDDYRGTLAECEIELYAAAKREGVLK